MITTADLTAEVQYKGAKMGDDFMLIGFVNIKHGDNLVFHANLIQRSMKDVQGLTAEEIQALAQGEADEILASEQAVKCKEDYINLVNLGLY